MKPYLISLVVGLLIGVIYALLKVRSPAPPMIALLGLLGMLLGELLVPIAKRFIAGEPVTISCLTKECGDHLFRTLPNAPAKADVSLPARTPTET